MGKDITGKISSFQTLGTLDGPGVRFVAFLQGCPLSCVCCHNPETWDKNGGTLYTALEVVRRAVRYREYFGEKGGITLSGGEPLLQPEFTGEIFKLCRKNGINTCLDTSGCITEVNDVLDYTDYCLLDIKYSSDEYYKKYVGCGIDGPFRFLKKLDEKGIPTRIRQVIIPDINDTFDNVKKLKEIVLPYKCVEEIELLPFRKLCASKYDRMGIDFKLKDTPEAQQSLIDDLKKYL